MEWSGHWDGESAVPAKFTMFTMHSQTKKQDYSIKLNTEIGRSNLCREQVSGCNWGGKLMDILLTYYQDLNLDQNKALSCSMPPLGKGVPFLCD